MRGLTEDEIKAYREMEVKVAYALIGDDIEFIDSILVGNKPDEMDKNVWAVLSLAHSIEKLAYADVVIAPGWMMRDTHPGCEIETQVARRYGKEVIELPETEIDRVVYRRDRNEDNCCIMESR